ncbi:hypothetical protein [Leptospira jelokensis]|uniref:Uncharacterized protein n=1 Tax=Leptospira jelokensis TaxID=2484931 RepID=A0A4Z0ZXW0_9LEPT|nr:hypothetical protein [Leptospira jelokensis]TGL58568.1 hypothetical protein EHQ62_16865 [Leptospira jelokensis]
MEIKEIRNILKKFETNIKFLIGSSNDDGFEALESIINFMRAESVFSKVIEKLEQHQYSEKELYKGRDFSRYKLPSNSNERSSFIWALINDWVKTKKHLDYFNLGYLYGGNTKNVNAHVKMFHESILLPFFEEIFNDLETAYLENSELSKGILIQNNSGSIALQSNSNNSTINISSDVHSTVAEIIKEIEKTNYHDKEQLVSLLILFMENTNDRLKDKGFLKLLMEKWNPYLSLIETSQHVVSFGKFIAPYLTNL